MLVLSRKPQQRILIGDDIVVEVLRIDRGRAKLGFRAPGKSIDREEIKTKQKSHGFEEKSGDGMLVFSRKPHEVACIGDDISVRVLRIERGRVKLGVDAPDDIKVDRGEVRGEGSSELRPHRSKESF